MRLYKYKVVYISTDKLCENVWIAGPKWPENGWLHLPTFVRKPGWPAFTSSELWSKLIGKNLTIYKTRRNKR